MGRAGAGLLAVTLLAACGGEPAGESRPRPSSRPARAPSPAPDPNPAWLRTLLAFELRGFATDQRTIALSGDLGVSVVCPQPGTGCYVELPLGEHVTHLHVGDDETLQIWGPTEEPAMSEWVAAVERELDASTLEAVNEAGARPDRLFRSSRRLVLLHDHTDQDCGGFCPAMMWVARPGHPAAVGYGFVEEE